MNLSAMTNQLNHSELDDPQMNSRWDAVREPAWECNQDVFAEFHRRHGYRRNVLNWAIPFARAKTLTDFTMPQGWNLDKSLIASVGFGARLPAGLENWSYTPKIQAVKQLPQMKELPREHSTLMHSPWFQSPSQAMGLGLNARHLRYHYQLWNELRPKTLRGVFTTLVYVTPQVGFSLTPPYQNGPRFPLLRGALPDGRPRPVAPGLLPLPGRPAPRLGEGACGYVRGHTSSPGLKLSADGRVHQSVGRRRSAQWT
jgi:hypothetical protein